MIVVATVLAVVNITLFGLLLWAYSTLRLQRQAIDKLLGELEQAHAELRHLGYTVEYRPTKA